MNKKVVMAMSGGVDSTVSALILKNKGYEVQGLFLDFFNDKKKAKDAIQAAKSVGIPLKIVDASKDFKKKIIGYFLDELRNGNTPNPCVVCNKEIKFKILIEKMSSMKGDLVATGHYARLRREFPISNFQFSKKYKDRRPRILLCEAKDKTKDQSYFLYRLNQKELLRIIFPLGKYTKNEVRKMAKKFKLSVYKKEESQDICFIPSKGYDSFLKQMLRLKKGKIVDLAGNSLGMHEGLPFYTIGQRKGIKVGGKGPYYVVRKDFRKNILVITNRKEDLKLFSDKISLKNVNWIIKKPDFPFKTLVRTRYRSPLVYGIINKGNKISLKNTQRAITPGQSAVFYSEKGEVLGGGIIDNF